MPIRHLRRSNLRTATFVVVLLSFAALAIGQWISGRWLYDGSFEAAERRDALARARHAQAIVRYTPDFLRRYAGDNAIWDDSYEFMLGRRPGLPDSVFGPESFRLLRLCGYAYIRLDGSIVQGRTYDRRQVIYTLPDRQFQDAASLTGVIGRHFKANHDSAGFARIGDRIVAWGAAPIVHSNGSGPAVGYLLLTSELDLEFLREASQTVDSLVALELRKRRAGEAVAPHVPLNSSDLRFSILNEGELQARFAVDTLDDTDVLDLAVTTPRVVHAAAVRASRYFLWSTLVFGTALGFLALQFIERRMLRPIQQASEALADIGARGDLSARLSPPPKNDQFGTLVAAANQMLARLESKRGAEAARDAAVAASRLKSEFLASMSHEIRTPMNGVLGMNELLLGSGLDAQQRQWAEAVHVSGQHLLGVINDVLDFSKIESGHMRLESIEFDLVDLVGQALSMFEQAARGKGLELGSRFEPAGQALGLLGDPVRLRQILLNLLSNAVKFTQHGRVMVRVQVRRIEGARAQIRLAVEDTGVGIEPEAHERIFEHFTQADGSTTRRYGGTGLGLAICQRLLALMGGSIRVESVPGQGSCFIAELVLPLAAATAAQRDARPSVAVVGSAAVPAPAPRGGQPPAGELLLVEDNAINQQVGKAMLQKLGWRVALAADGAEAVEAVRTRDFDAVLMDCEMPVMDGYEATAAIRRLPDGRGEELTIIALTANAIRGDAQRCLAAGMDDFLAKPYTQAQLGLVLARWTHAAPPAPAPAAPVLGPAPDGARGAINRRVLESYREIDPDGGMGLAAQIMRSYLQGAASELEAIELAIEEGDLACLARSAHSLKSSTANVGAESLSALFRRIEMLAVERRPAEIRSLMEPIRQETGRASSEIRDLLAELP